MQCLYEAELESSARELRQNVRGETVRQNAKYVRTGKPISGEFACDTDMWRVQGRKGTAMSELDGWEQGNGVCVCIIDGDD